MVELADAPEAIKTERKEITPDRTNSEDRTAQEEQKTEEKPEKLEVTEPEQEVAEETPQPVEKEEKPEPIEKAESLLPPVQQKKPEPKKPEPKKPEPKKQPPKKPPPKKEPPKEKPKEKPKPRNQEAAPQSRASIEAQAQVRESERTAAAQTASGVSSQSPANWQSQLMAHLESRKRYPQGARSRGERGIVYVRFTIDASGNVQSASLDRSSGFSELDEEVLSLVRRASPVPAPPAGAHRTIVAPVRFSTN
jgi:protein TonB